MSLLKKKRTKKRLAKLKKTSLINRLESFSLKAFHDDGMLLNFVPFRIFIYESDKN